MGARDRWLWNDAEWSNHYDRELKKAHKHKDALKGRGTLTPEMERVLDREIERLAAKAQEHYKRAVDKGQLKPK